MLILMLMLILIGLSLVGDTTLNCFLQFHDHLGDHTTTGEAPQACVGYWNIPTARRTPSLRVVQYTPHQKAGWHCIRNACP